MDYHALLHYVPMMYIGSVVALLGTYADRGARSSARGAGFRWARGIHLQVSEFVKLVIILLVARYLTDLKTDELEIREMLKLAGLVLIPAVLVLTQPDLGTSLTYIAVLVAGRFSRGCVGSTWPPSP